MRAARGHRATTKHLSMIKDSLIFALGFASCWALLAGLAKAGENLMRKRGVRWYCRRCQQPVDQETGRCGCKDSPSPWEEL